MTLSSICGLAQGAAEGEPCPPGHSASFAGTESPAAPARTVPRLEVTRLAEVDAFEQVQEEWQALHERLAPRTPFTSPLWNALWWKHYRSQRLSVRDELYLHVVRDAGGALVAVAPMMATERPSLGPARLRTITCFGADPNVTEVRGIICQPQHETAALAALSAHFTRHDPSWAWIQWGVVRDQNWADAARCLRGRSPSTNEQVVDYHLDLPRTWEEFRASRSRNVKESIRKCYNSLKREGLEAELRVVEGTEECAAALQTFFRLHADRGRATDTVVHGDVFEQQQERAFMAEYVEAVARRGQLRLLQLWISGQVVATRLGFLLGDQLYLYYSGYDVAWGKFSVMTTLLAEAIKWAIAQGLPIVNLSTGSDVSKLRWRPVATQFRAVIQVSHRWRARLAFGAYEQARRLQRHPRLGRLLALAGR
jgi:CelD/BcsL family acetyltransferase involved in cellulose biosynthesis